MNRDVPKFRYGGRRAGVVILIAVAVFFAAVLQAGVLQNLFKSELDLRVILPETGLSGLSSGATVEILGTDAGRVEEIVLDPDTNFYARVRIDRSMEPFVRRDSTVFIRRQFGIAGAAYLEIGRGHGDPLDWDFAVLTAEQETAATASVGELVEELRDKILPVVADTQRTIRAAAELVEGLNDPEGALRTALTSIATVAADIEAGNGNVGRLLRDDALITELEGTIDDLRGAMLSVAVVMANMENASGEAAALTAELGAQSVKLPEMIDNANGTLASLNETMTDMKRSLPEITDLVRNSADASDALPVLLTQAQQTLIEMERLLAQLQGSWLLGGTERPPPAGRLPPTEARP